MSSRSLSRANLADQFIARWLKSGMAGKAPPPDARSRLLSAAVGSAGGIRRRWYPAARGEAPMGIAVPPDDWSLGLARQAVLRWFPAMVISYRIGH
jgi:hypothetical protein